MPLLFADDALTGPYGTLALDGFGTADGTAPPVNWSTGSGLGAADGTITEAGYHTSSAGGGYRHGSYYSRGGAYSFAGMTKGIEVWSEFAAVSSLFEHALFAAVNPTGSPSVSMYMLAVDWSSGGGSPIVYVDRHNPTQTSILNLGTTSLAVGDQIAMCLKPSGANIIVEVWRRQAGGSWTKLGNATDTSPITSDVSLGEQFAGGTGFKSRVFGGGAFTPPVNIAVALALNPTVSRVIDRKIAAPLSFSAAVSRLVSRSVAVPLTLSPTVSRVVSRSVSATLNLVPSAVRRVERRINLAFTFAMSVTPTFVPGGGGGPVARRLRSFFGLGA